MTKNGMNILLQGARYKFLRYVGGDRLSSPILLLLFLVLCHSVSVYGQTESTPAIGSGTETDPYLIMGLENLRWLSEDSEDWWIDAQTKVFFKQTSDIDASETLSWNNGEGFLPIGHPTVIGNLFGRYFVGEYDGDGFLINGLYIYIDTLYNKTYGGLFGFVRNFSVLKNISLENNQVNVIVNTDYLNQNANSYTGAIAGALFDSTILSCYSTGSVNAYAHNWGSNGYSGGIVGISDNSIIGYSYSTGYITSTHYAGGISGITLNSDISFCHSTGNVETSNISRSANYAGGITGYSETTTISNCYSTGNMTSTIDFSYAGGISGYLHYSTIYLCFSTGNMTSIALWAYTGGLIGQSSYTSIISCYSTGNIVVNGTGAYDTLAGGIVGSIHSSPEITDCYSSGNITGFGYNPRVGGIVGAITEGFINRCYSIGTINAFGDNRSSIGGIAASVSRTTISQSYSIATINQLNENAVTIGGIIGNGGIYSNIEECYMAGVINYETNVEHYVGGLLGTISTVDMNIIRSFWDIETTNITDISGMEGGALTVINSFGLPTQEMKQSATFIGNSWDFDNTWNIDPDINIGYPYLNAQPIFDILLPVTNLTANVIDNNVNLFWDAPSGYTGILVGYEVYRNMLLLTSSPITNLYITDNQVPNGSYIYIVAAVYWGESPIGTHIEVEVDFVTEKEEFTSHITTSLHSNYPNPFNPETIISFDLAIDSLLRIDIYNIKGQLIKKLINKYVSIGSHSIVWNGTDENNILVSSGIYFYKMQAGEYISIKKMVMLK